MFYGRIINSTISNAITNVGSASGSALPAAPDHVGGCADVPERPRERIGHAGAAGRRRLRATTRRTRWCTSTTRSSSSGSARARWCRCPTLAAPAATCRSSSTPTCPRPRARSATPRSADRSTVRRSRRRSSPGARPNRELRAHHDDLAPGRLEVQRAGAAGESPAEQGTAVPGQLHRSARDRQRPELADLHVGQQRAESVRARARGRHVELRDPSPVRRQRHLESQRRGPRAPR